MKKLYFFQFLMLCSACAFAQVSVTFSVDMTDQTVSANGMFVAGDFQGWSPGQADYELKDTDGDNVYRVTVDNVNPSGGMLTFKYVNDNAWGNNETFGSEDGDCIIEDADGNKNRQVTIPADVTSVELPTWIYDSCTESSIISSVQTPTFEGSMKITPNPLYDVAILTFSNPSNEELDFQVTNLTGQVVQAQRNVNSNNVEINRGNLASGIYFASLISKTGKVATQRLVIQ